MHGIRIVLFAATASMFLLARPQPALSFTCGSGSGQHCSCEGTSDCNDMRHSNLCGSSLNCVSGAHGPVCTCVSVRENDPGGSDTGNTGVRRPGDNNVAPVPPTARPPP
jgi:hypothetical protein